MVETTKDAEKNSLKENAIREEKEAVAATRPLKRDEVPSTESVDLSAEDVAGASDETLAKKTVEEGLLSDVSNGEVDSSHREPLRRSMDDDGSFQPEAEKHRVEFYGSELLRSRAPKTFEFADAVVDDWMKDGRFEGLPVGHPLLQLAAQMGFRKAKDIEKKLDEKGVFLIARTGLEYLKTKIPKK